MNAVVKPVFDAGTTRVISPAIALLRDVGRPPAPPPLGLCGTAARRPAVPECVMALLRKRHRDHLVAARFWDAPALGAFAITVDREARDRHMSQAAEIRRAVFEAGDEEEAAMLSAAEAAAKAGFG